MLEEKGDIGVETSVTDIADPVQVDRFAAVVTTAVPGAHPALARAGYGVRRFGPRYR